MDVTAAELLDDLTRLEIEAALVLAAIRLALTEFDSPLPCSRPRPPKLPLAA